MTGARAVQAKVLAWLGPSVEVRAAQLDPNDLASMWPTEREHVQHAVLKRQIEFATVRRLARGNLAAMGIPLQALVPRPDRSPVWPADVVGSITHGAGLGAVICAASASWRSLGVDIEARREFTPGMQAMVLGPQERQDLSELGPEAQERRCVQVFCLKEAFYKFQAPLTGIFLDFLDVRLRGGQGTPWRIEVASEAHPRASKAFERLGAPSWTLQSAWLDATSVLGVVAQRATGDAA